MFSQEIKNKLLDLANKGAFKECEDLIEEFKIPYEIGKEIYEILFRLYKQWGRLDLVDEFGRMKSNREYYNKFFSIEQPSQVNESSSFESSLKKSDLEKGEHIKYHHHFSELTRLLDAEKKAQEYELKKLFNTSFNFLTEREFALIDIDDFEGPYLYDENIFEEKIEKWKVKFKLKEKHKQIIDSLKFKVNGSVFIYSDDDDIEYNKKIFKGPIKTKAIIDEINKDKNQICLLVDKETAADLRRSRNKTRKYSLVRWIDETTYKIQKEALIEISNGNVVNKHILEILANDSLPRDKFSMEISKFFLSLNDYQKACVNDSFKNRDFFLIHGPPGTGKTKVCSEIAAQQLLRHPDSKILICADSNQATDNILDSVADILPKEFHIRMLRVGSISKIRPDNKKFMLAYQKDNHPLQFHIGKIIKENKELINLKRKIERDSKIGYYLSIFEQIKMEKIKEKLLLTSTHPSNVAPNIYFDQSIIKKFSRSIPWRKFIGFSKDKGIKVNLKDNLIWFTFEDKNLDLMKLIEEFIQDSRSNSDKIERLEDLEIQLMEIISRIQWTKDNEGIYSLENYNEKLDLLEKSRENLAKEIIENPLRKINEINKKIQENNDHITQLKKQIYYEIVSSANIIFCTNTVSGKKIITETLKTTSFDLAIIDEATQSTIFSTFVPLIKSRKVIMAGDYHQLPPTVNLKNSVEGETKEECKERNKLAKELEKTIFERLFIRFKGNNHYVYTLKIQYRMNPSIVPFINDHFYRDEPLQSDKSCEGRNIHLIFKSPLVLINVGGKEIKRGYSYLNYYEADVVTSIINKFKELGYRDFNEVGVITPYAAQVELLSNKLKKFGIVAKTIDGFQGQERDIIIISLVRTDINKLKIKTDEQKQEYELRTCREYDEIKSTIGFLSDMRRLNVMITRFRKKLIIIGNKETLSRFDIDPEDPSNKILYKELFDYIENNNFGQTIYNNTKLKEIFSLNLANFDKRSEINSIVKLSEDYDLLCKQLISSIKPSFSFNLLIRPEDKLKNTFIRKYYSDEEDYASLIRLNIKEGLEDSLGTISIEKNKEVLKEWNYWEKELERRDVLQKSIEENGKNIVKTALKLVDKTSPLDLNIKKAAKEDLLWIDKDEIVDREEKTVDRIDEKSIEKVRIVTRELTLFITRPYDPEGNFDKIQGMIFDKLGGNVLVVDYMIRCGRKQGLENLYKHLRISKKLNEVGLLTTNQVLVHGEKNGTGAYRWEVEDYSSRLGYPILVKLVSNDQDAKGLHGRFIYTEDKGWSIPMGLNILEKKQDTIVEITDTKERTTAYNEHLSLFKKGLDLIKDFFDIKKKIDFILGNNKNIRGK